MKHKTLTISLIVIILLGLAFGLYWYLLVGPMQPAASNGNQSNNPNGFQPFGNTGPYGSGGSSATSTSTDQNPTSGNSASALPALRLLSGTPVGGYGVMASTTTTLVRWVDRGRGNVYEANYLSSDITTLSNTLVPRMYDSSWNKPLTSFIGSLFQSGDSSPTIVYASLLPQATATSSDGTITTPYALRGKNLPGDVIAYAVSPDKSKLFMLTNEDGNGVGYVSTFSGQNTVKIFTTPFTQVNVAWPSDNIIAITTKSSSVYNGYLYFVSPKTGVWTKVIGPVPGLSDKVSSDGQNVIYSGTASGGSIFTKIYNVSKSTDNDAVIRTIADKCAWGNFYKEMVYCGVPTSLASGNYPDDWYDGSVSTVDKIWQVNASTGQVNLISPVVGQADRSIDAFNLSLDPKDNYLFLMGKNDLSLWSLDLVQGQ